MIGCDYCEEWFHISCLSITKDKVKELTKCKWMCPKCELKNAKLSNKGKTKTNFLILLECHAVSEMISNILAQADDVATKSNTETSTTNPENPDPPNENETGRSSRSKARQKRRSSTLSSDSSDSSSSSSSDSSDSSSSSSSSSSNESTSQAQPPTAKKLRTNTHRLYYIYLFWSKGTSRHIGCSV